MALMSIGKFAKQVGLSQQHLRKLHEDKVLIPAVISPGGTRYYSDEQLSDYLNVKPEEKDLPVVLYARVSTKSQCTDLDKQIENLKQYAYSKGYNFDIVTDIGSGDEEMVIHDGLRDGGYGCYYAIVRTATNP